VRAAAIRVRVRRIGLGELAACFLFVPGIA
jgi:hypothetical protein